MDAGKRTMGSPSTLPPRKRLRVPTAGPVWLSSEDSDESIYVLSPLRPPLPCIDLTEDTESESESPELEEEEIEVEPEEEEEEPVEVPASVHPSPEYHPAADPLPESETMTTSFQQLVASLEQAQHRISELETELEDHRQRMARSEVGMAEASRRAAAWQCRALEAESMRDRAQSYTQQMTGQFDHLSRIASLGSRRLSLFEDGVEGHIEQAMEPLRDLIRQIHGRRMLREAARREGRREGTPSPARHDGAGPSGGAGPSRV